MHVSVVNVRQQNNICTSESLKYEAGLFDLRL